MNETPAIFNSAQGSQFSSGIFTGQLEKNGISMDGECRWSNNVLAERAWNSIEFEKAISTSARLSMKPGSRSDVTRSSIIPSVRIPA